MKHTANYQLSQWAMTDRIRMEDFNSDNAKIDAALSEKVSFLKLKEVSVAEKQSQVDIPVADIDWSRWQRVHIDVSTGSTALVTLWINGKDTRAFYHYFNQQSTDYYHCLFRFSGLAEDGFSERITLTPGGTGKRYVQALNSSGYGSSTYMYEELQTLNFVSSFQPNAKIIIWGEA